MCCRGQRASIASSRAAVEAVWRGGRRKRWTAESELRSYGRARACISLANTHPTQHRRLRRSSPRSKQRQSAKGTPALAYEHHQRGASAFVQVPSTTSPLICPRRPTVPSSLKRAPMQPSRAHGASCSTQLCFWQPGDALCTLLRASLFPKRQRKRAGDVPEHRRRRNARAEHG